MPSYIEYAKHQASVAKCLSQGGGGGGYGEAMLILCAAISAMAARRWPLKNGGDRKRFIQILIEADQPVWGRVSLPLFYQSLNGCFDGFEGVDLDKFKQNLIDHKIPSHNEDVFYLSQMINRFGNKYKKSIISNSYAGLLYEGVRCGYVHEMSCCEKTSNYPGFFVQSDCPSYVNSSDGVKIHFPIELISKSLLKVGCFLDAMCIKYNVLYSCEFDVDEEYKFYAA